VLLFCFFFSPLSQRPPRAWGPFHAIPLLPTFVPGGWKNPKTCAAGSPRPSARLSLSFSVHVLFWFFFCFLCVLFFCKVKVRIRAQNSGVRRSRPLSPLLFAPYFFFTTSIWGLFVSRLCFSEYLTPHPACGRRTLTSLPCLNPTAICLASFFLSLPTAYFFYLKNCCYCQEAFWQSLCSGDPELSRQS